jgi:uncharacterized protein YhhL (DUF1145 family)
MGLFEYIALCLVVGLVVYLINRLAPIPQEIKTIILVAAIIVLLIILLRALGVMSGGPQIPRLW